MSDLNKPCPICPNCGSADVDWLEATSHDTQVDYCRCRNCTNVFSVSRDAARTVRNVTTTPKKRVTVPVRCTECKAALDATISDWSHGGTIYTAPITCPVCHQPTTVALAGRVLSVQPRGE